MTDDALTRLLAEKVMGWPVSRTEEDAIENWETGQVLEWEHRQPEDRILAPGGEIWRPLTRIDHAWQVRERLAEFGTVTISNRVEAARASNYCLADWFSADAPFRQAEAFAPTAARAICLAALRAVGQDVEEG